MIEENSGVPIYNGSTTTIIYRFDSEEHCYGCSKSFPPGTPFLTLPDISTYGYGNAPFKLCLSCVETIAMAAGNPAMAAPEPTL